MLCGFLWATIFWLFIRFIFARFMLEYLESWKPARIIFRNDYDPKFLYSHWKGNKYEAKTKGQKDTGTTAKVTGTTKERNWPRMHIFAFHMTYIIINVLLGILGIIIGAIQHDRDPNCDKAAPTSIISAGCVTILSAMVLGWIAFLVWIKLSPKMEQWSWHQDALSYSHYFWTFVAFEAAYWCIAGTATVTQNCQSTISFNIGLFYFAFWFAVEGVLLIVYFIFGYIWDFLPLFSVQVNDNETVASREVEKS